MEADKAEAVLFGHNKITMEKQIQESSDKLKQAMEALQPQLEQLKREAERHKIKSQKELKNYSVSLSESGFIIIKFTDIKEAEKFYNNL